METKKLYRSNENKVFTGVCGGFGVYFEVDPVIIRLVWALVSIPSFGTGLLVYIIASLVIPSEGDEEGARKIGCLLVVIGILVLSVIGTIFSVFGASFFAWWRIVFSEGFPHVFSGYPFGMGFVILNGIAWIGFLALVLFLIYAFVKKSRKK